MHTIFQLLTICCIGGSRIFSQWRIHFRNNVYPMIQGIQMYLSEKTGGRKSLETGPLNPLWKFAFSDSLSWMQITVFSCYSYIKLYKQIYIFQSVWFMINYKLLLKRDLLARKVCQISIYGALGLTCGPRDFCDPPSKSYDFRKVHSDFTAAQDNIWERIYFEDVKLQLF
jgi:hypothetical protein